jgi:hypothetical protein
MGLTSLSLPNCTRISHTQLFYVTIMINLLPIYFAYNDLTGNFPFTSYDGSVCYLVVHHYESNAILALPISSLDDKTIFDAYKSAFDELVAKGFKPKSNIMDNQATKYIKKNLTKEECKLQLVEPHNHRINAAERVIQTFKDAFIAALTTTDLDFLLHCGTASPPRY